MFKCDASFLLLSSPGSNASNEMYKLLDFLSEAGVDCKIATHPIELAIRSSPQNSRLIIIDGTDDLTFDVYALTAVLCCFRNATIALIVDNTPSARVRGLRSGAHICLPLMSVTSALGPTLLDAIGRVSGELTPAPEGQLTAQRRDQAHTPSLYPLLTESSNTSQARKPPTVAEGPPSSWTLTNGGWRLISPSGVSLQLTSAERDLMTQFSSAPGVTVLHEEFSTSGAAPTNGRSLSAVVSRLRRKCHALGVSLPIHSRRGKGYEFMVHSDFDEPYVYSRYRMGE